MVYTIVNYDFYNNYYKNILKIALSNSDCFSFFTSKHIHKKEHPDKYFDFLERLNTYKISSDEIETPKYTTGQQIHCYRINKITTQILNEPTDFAAWNSYDYPEDLTFYRNNTPWFRCISHERIVLINETNTKAFEELKKLGLTFMKIKDTNFI